MHKFIIREILLNACINFSHVGHCYVFTNLLLSHIMPKFAPRLNRSNTTNASPKRAVQEITQQKQLENISSLVPQTTILTFFSCLMLCATMGIHPERSVSVITLIFLLHQQHLAVIFS